jgi:hypothetical protein
VETGLGITASSCATLRPLVRYINRWFHHRFTPDNSTTTQTDSSTNEDGKQADIVERSSLSLQNDTPTSMSNSSDTRNEKFRTSASVQPSAFFLETVRSMDSIDEHFATNDFDHFGAGMPRQHSFDQLPETDLESNWTNHRLSRATWWPMPRASIVAEDSGTGSTARTDVSKKQAKSGG